jgi:hypothetical protein
MVVQEYLRGGPQHVGLIYCHASRSQSPVLAYLLGSGMGLGEARDLIKVGTRAGSQRFALHA